MSESDSGYGKSEQRNFGEIPAPDLPYLPPIPRAYCPKIGLIGCGGISEYHLRAYRAMGLEVAALCNRSTDKAEARRAEFYPGAMICSDYHEVLAQDDIEVVDITTHADIRAGMIEAALLAGKHVLSQKPLVLDLAVGTRLADLADERGLKLAVNQNGRWAPHFSWMRTAVNAGLIGRVNSATFSLQWDHTWVAGTPFDEMRHLLLFDFAVHWFEICTSFMGEATATSLSATVAHAPGQTAKPPLLAQVLIDYPDAQATMSFNGTVRHGQQDTTVICGERGTLRSTGPSLSEQQVTLHTDAGWSRPNLQGTWFDEGFQGAMGELLCAIEEDRVPLNNARDNLRSLALCFAACASADRGGARIRPGEVTRAAD